jgi:Cytochrome D1 heme domain
VRGIETAGPGSFLRTREKSPYLWADVFFGPNRDKMHVIDRETLEIVRTLRPVPGATVAHAEFDRDGKHVLVSVWEDGGAVIVCDAATLEEVKRLPMKKPSGKYNVWNKIIFSEGTSH